MSKDELIIRRHLTENFTVLPNDLLNDELLKSDALALMCYLLSKPQDWIVRHKEIQNRMDWGRDKTRNVIASLVQLGYIEKETIREDGKFSETRYIVKDSPRPEKPSPENQLLVISHLNKDIGQRTDNTKSNKIARQKKQLLVDWSPDTEDKVYATERGLDWQEILEDIKIWNEKNGNKAAYASLKAFWQGWVRKEAKARPTRLNRQQSACESKRVATLSPKQEEYAKSAALKLAQQYKDEYFRYDDILKAVNAFMLTDQTDESWKAIGLGLPRPF